MKDNILEVNHVSKHFPGEKNPSLADVSIEIKRGSCLGIVGESGSGKSTLARAITGLIEIDSGSIIFEGNRIDTACQREYKKIYRDLQMIFQFPKESFNPVRTIGSSIALTLKNFEYGGDVRQRAVSLLEKCGLEESFYNRYPRSMSGGECQRAAIARALAAAPKLLICDEATSALDMSVQKRILELLKELQKELDMSMLFICHDIALVHNICDYVAVMKSASMVEYGVASEIIHKPKHEYTRALIKAAAVC